MKEKQKKEVVETMGEGVLVVVLAIALILGSHIKYVVSDTITTYQIVRYTWRDAIICVIAIIIIYCIIKWIRTKIERHDKRQICFSSKKPSTPLFVSIAVCLFAVWLPYLYLYYPAFVFKDSRSSLLQAMGQTQLNNHFPVIYTLFIKCCLRVGMHLGSLVKGIALYSVLQMLFMALGLAYFLSWLEARFSLKRWMTVITTLIFAFSRYIAQYSVAMWKDPIFSIAVVLVTIWVAEIAYGKKESVGMEVWKMIRLLMALLLMILSRNNGFYITLAILVLALLGVLFSRNRKTFGKITAILVISILCSKVITGPLYTAWGVVQDDEKTESYGIFLTQMARVVVYDGKLSESDRAYMDQILPIEEYATVYKPDCIDSLKWSEHYNGAVLEHDFFKTYLSILKKNPKICFEAWELQTFGFWSLNQPQVNTFDGNVLAGVLRNVQPDGVGIEGIWTKPVDDNSIWTKIFPYRAKCIPVAYVHWILIGLALFALIRGNWRRLVVLAPALGLMATLIIASPIYYWPRYGLAQQLLLPLFIIMIFVREGESTNG